MSDRSSFGTDDDIARAGLVAVTHDRIGEDILAVASEVYGSPPLVCNHAGMRHEDSSESWRSRLALCLDRADGGSGMLILTDVFGATPHNSARAAALSRRASIVSGINLPMVLRIFNYAHLGLAELARAAATGGQRGIVDTGAGD